mgnify:FL=1
MYDKIFLPTISWRISQHICIAFTNYNCQYDYDAKDYKLNEFVPKVMNLISECTNESVKKNPKVICVESKLRDYESKSQIEDVIKLAKKLSVIKRLDYSARPSSPTTHIYHTEYRDRSPKIEEPKIEPNQKIDDYDYSPSFSETIDNIINVGGSLYTGAKYAQSKKGGNSFLNFCKGMTLYDDIKNNNISREDVQERLKKDDDCNIF